jgi:PPOX class probable F420-dependent enzyme
MTASKVPEGFRDLLADEARAFAQLATIMPDGSPQLTTVWFDTEGDTIRVNTAEGRTKWRNMMARPRVALLIADPQDPYRFLQIRGVVTGWTHDGARAHIDRLARKYRGWDSYPVPAGQQRVIFAVRPESVYGEA